MLDTDALFRAIVKRDAILAWDDREDREHSSFKNAGPLRMSSIALSEPVSPLTLSQFIRQAEMARQNATEFFSVETSSLDYKWSKSSIEFRSVDEPEKDIVTVRNYGVQTGSHAIVLIPHWNASERDYAKMGRMLGWLGLSTFVITLPYHGSRGDGGPVANAFLSADIGATVNAVRQAVVEVRQLIRILSDRGFRSISVLGISLGSCIAALAATFESRVGRTALLLSAGDFAETVWHGSATRHIREHLQNDMSLEQLRRAWSVISPSSYLERLAARQIPMLLILGQEDRVVPYAQGQKFSEGLRNAGVKLDLLQLPCGHYSIAMLPFASTAFVRVALFMRSETAYDPFSASRPA